MLATALIILMVVLLFFAAALLIRTMTFARPFQPVEPVEGLEIDSAVVAEHLSAAVRCETFATGEKLTPNRKGLFQLHKLLEKLYPRVHATLQREVVESYSLLYTWVGSQPDLPAVVLMAHLDVVPADSASLAAWSYPPFAGQIADGSVWGRGTRDVKNQVICLLEAVEGLLKNGFQPQRTIYLAFGHDEETLVGSGARQIAALLQERCVEVSAVLDEGGFLTVGMVPGTSGTIGLIGVAEKGYATLKITALAKGGHSSAPPPETGVVVLAKAVLGITSQPFPMRFEGPGADMVRALAPDAGLAVKMAVANDWLFAPLLVRKIAATPAGAASLHTTIAPTMLRGSPKENVLPQDATAWINYRIAPGQTAAQVMEHARNATRNLEVELAWEGRAYDPPPVSSDDSDAYRLIATLASDGGKLPVAPGLVTATTDSRSLAGIAEHIYRFSPMVASLRDFEMIHGTNEHMTLENLGRMTGFYSRLIATAAR